MVRVTHIFITIVAFCLSVNFCLIVYVSRRVEDNRAFRGFNVHNDSPLDTKSVLNYYLGTTELKDDDHWESPQSLMTYLEKRPLSKYTKRNPVCPFSAKNRVHVAIPFYNLKESVIKEALTSVINQQYLKDLVHIWVYDDGSYPTSVLNSVCSGEENVFDFTPGGDDVMDDTMHVLHELNRHNFKADNIPSMMCCQGPMFFWCGERIGPTLSAGQQVMASHSPLLAAASANARCASTLPME